MKPIDRTEFGIVRRIVVEKASRAVNAIPPTVSLLFSVAKPNDVKPIPSAQRRETNERPPAVILDVRG